MCMKNTDGAKASAPATPDPKMLGDGLAGKAGAALKSRKSKMELAIKEAGA